MSTSGPPKPFDDDSSPSGDDCASSTSHTGDDAEYEDAENVNSEDEEDAQEALVQTLKNQGVTTPKTKREDDFQLLPWEIEVLTALNKYKTEQSIDMAKMTSMSISAELFRRQFRQTPMGAMYLYDNAVYNLSWLFRSLGKEKVVQVFTITSHSTITISLWKLNNSKYIWTIQHGSESKWNGLLLVVAPKEVKGKFQHGELIGHWDVATGEEILNNNKSVKEHALGANVLTQVAQVESFLEGLKAAKKDYIRGCINNQDRNCGMDNLSLYASRTRSSDPNVQFFGQIVDLLLHHRVGGERSHDEDVSTILELCSDWLCAIGWLFQQMDPHKCCIIKVKMMFLALLKGMKHHKFDEDELKAMIIMWEKNFEAEFPDKKPAHGWFGQEKDKVFVGRVPIGRGMKGHHAMRTSLRGGLYKFYLILTRGVHVDRLVAATRGDDTVIPAHPLNGTMKRGVTHDVKRRFEDYGNEVVGEDIEYGRSWIQATAAGLIESVMFFVVNTLMPINGCSEYGLHTEEMYLGVRLVLSWLEEYNASL